VNRSESFFAGIQRRLAHQRIEQWYGSLGIQLMSQQPSFHARMALPGAAYQVWPHKEDEPLFKHTCEYCGRRSTVAPLTSCVGCGAPPTEEP
jgi:hypothetical protein